MDFRKPTGVYFICLGVADHRGFTPQRLYTDDIELSQYGDNSPWSDLVYFGIQKQDKKREKSCKFYIGR
jgi:hypothetical protein